MIKMHVLQEILVVCVIMCLAVTGGQQMAETQNSEADDNPKERQKRTVGNPHSGQLQTLVNALEDNQGEGMTNTELYLHYTPSTPAPHQINCYIETKTMRGGRCIQMGRRGRPARQNLWMCQAGIDLGVSPDCPPRSSRRSRG